MAVELGFNIADGNPFIDNLVNDAIRVDDSVNADQFGALGLFDPSNDTYYIDRGDACCGFDTANPGNNPFTGEGIDGYFQADDLTQFAVALGGGAEGMEPFDGGGFLLPLMQLVTTPGAAGTLIDVAGIIAQDLRDTVGADSWDTRDIYPNGLQVSDLPEPTTFLMSGLALVGMVALRRRS